MAGREDERGTSWRRMRGLEQVLAVAVRLLQLLELLGVIPG